MVALPQLIILFVTDQFRLDAFHPDITPNLHKLSLLQNATTFTNAYVSTPTCTPARASLLTGKSPWAHGMLGYANSVSCENYPTTLPDILSEMGGYETYSVGKNHFGWGRHEKYITHGYENLETYEGMSRPSAPDDYARFFHKLHPNENPLDVTCHGLGYNDWKACPYGSSNEEQHPTDWTTRQALRYLKNFDFKDEEDTDKRMFLKVSYHRPHSPYDPPLRLFEKFLYNETRIPKRFINNTSWDRSFQNPEGMSHDDWHGDPGEEAALNTRAGYLASVQFVDEGVGLIIDWLAGHDNNLLDNSMIMWTSDHGDMNGDHNLWRKGYPYEASSHVNLVMKLPKDNTPVPAQLVRREIRNEQRATTSPAIVETRDIAVTIYDFLGILDYVKARDPFINGESLLPILTGHATKVRNWIDLEHARLYHDVNHWNAIVGLYPDKDLPDEGEVVWKFIFHVYDGEEQLFCLSKDPNESYDLSKVKPDITEHFREVMVGQFEDEDRGSDWVKNGQLTVHRPSVLYGKNFPCPKPFGFN